MISYWPSIALGLAAISLLLAAWVSSRVRRRLVADHVRSLGEIVATTGQQQSAMNDLIATGRAAARADMRVPAESDIVAAIERAKAAHVAHEKQHHAEYPRHVSEEAIRQRARNELAAAGFRFVPIDLHARVKKVR